MTDHIKTSSRLIETIKYQNVIYKLKFCHQSWLTRCFLSREIKESKNTFQVNHSVSMFASMYTTMFTSMFTNLPKEAMNHMNGI